MKLFRGLSSTHNDYEFLGCRQNTGSSFAVRFPPMAIRKLTLYETQVLFLFYFLMQELFIFVVSPHFVCA
jgi:hypothetical protein